MRDARMAILALAAALAGCHPGQQENSTDQNMTLDDAVADNSVDANAAIETLPPDESSTTPSNQLQNGFDNPDMNDAASTNTE
jgi:hypothetical protein